MSQKSQKQIDAIRRSLGCRMSRTDFVLPNMSPPEPEESDETSPSASRNKRARKVPVAKTMSSTERFEMHLLVNSIPSTIGSTRNRATAELRSLAWLFDQVPYTDPSCNRGIVLGDAMQMSRFIALCLNPQAHRDPIILFVDDFDNKYLLDGLQTWSTVVRVLDGGLPIYMDEKVFLDAYPGLEIEGEPQKGFLFLSNTDNAATQVFYDFERNVEEANWKVPKQKKKRERCENNVETWSSLFVRAYENRFLGCTFHNQLETSCYVSEGIVGKIREDVCVPVIELKKEHGWTLKDASFYVADIMSNREPLCPHEVCMILHIPAVTMLKELAFEPVCKDALSRLLPDIRGAHFAVLLSAALLLKGSPGAPGSESTQNLLKSMVMELELVDDDMDMLKVGLEIFATVDKFPRPFKERLALAIAYLAKYPESDLNRVMELFRQSNKFLKGEEGGTQFIESTKDNLANSFLAMERLMGEAGEAGEAGSVRTVSFVAKEGDLEIIDLT